VVDGTKVMRGRAVFATAEMAMAGGKWNPVKGGLVGRVALTAPGAMG
jgi:hypothetical protein